MVLLGYLAPLYVVPLLQVGAPAATCAYCILLVLWWNVLSVLPAPVTSMLPMLLFTVGDVLGEDVAIASYISPYALHMVAAMIVIGAGKSAKLFDRIAIVVLRNHGTRIRSLLLGFAGMALFLSLFLDNSITTLVMVAFIERAILTIQDNTIQNFQKKALFNKVTRRYSRTRRKTLEELCLRTTESIADLDPSRRGSTSIDEETRNEGRQSFTPEATVGIGRQGSPVPAVPASVTVNDVKKTTARANRQLSLVSPVPSPKYFLAGTPKARKPSVVSAIKPRAQSASSDRRRISIMERGQIVLPGSSSPDSRRNSLPAVLTARRRSTMFSSVFDTVGLRDIASWEKERYGTIRRDLVVGVVMVTVIGSIVSTGGNMATIFLFSYLEMRFDRKVMYGTTWVLIVIPVVSCGLLACFSVMYFVLLRHYDAEEDEHTRLGILKVLEKHGESLGNKNLMEDICFVVPVCVLFAWLLANGMVTFSVVTGSGYFKKPTDAHMLVFDYVVVLLLVSIPQGTKASADTSGTFETDGGTRINTVPTEWRTSVPDIRWGPLIIYGSVSCIAKAMQMSGLMLWIQAVFNEFYFFTPATIQAVLTIVSSVLTELISIEVTVHLLIPVVVELALKVPCNPLYFAIPVAVAASTTLILPTAAIPVAILDDMLNISRRNLLLQGMLIKLVTIASLLFSMNTVGDTLFSWNEMPTWAQTGPRHNASSVSRAWCCSNMIKP